MSRVVLNMKVVHTSSASSSFSSTMPSHQDSKDVATPKVPRGLRSLPLASSYPSQPSARSELAELQQDAAAIERWWAQPRWKHTKRVYAGKL